MQQLVKPSEYAQMYGLSRQSVYAKIKRGTLPARKIDGRYYVIVATNIESEIENEKEETLNEEKIEHVSLIDKYREIIKAKDETIAVLKNSIEDLKEANEQITKTLQEEIALLKQAFNEMRAIYLTNYQITHSNNKTETTIDVETEEEVIKEDEPKTKNDYEHEECWIPLGDLIQRQQYNYNKAKQVVKRFKKAYKKGDKRIKKQNGIYFISCYDFYEDILE